MSGWPWMKDVQLEQPIESSMMVAEPIVIEGYDEHRPPVKDLIQANQDLIDELKKELSSTSSSSDENKEKGNEENDNEDEAKSFLKLYDPKKHDDLWLLRFLLSHKKNVSKSLDAIKTTLNFRHKHSLDVKDIRKFPPQVIRNTEVDVGNKLNEAVHRFLEDGNIQPESISLVVPDKQRGGSIFYFNIASLDTHKLGSDVDVDDWLLGINYINEWSFQWLDYITRTTGRLTKAVHIIDVEGISFTQYDNTTQSKYVKAAQTLQDCYPQAVKAYMVCHAPFWIETPWRILKPLLPTRVVEKLDFLNPTKYDDDRIRLLQYVSSEFLPTRFGGEYESWPPMMPDHDANNDNPTTS